MLRSILLLVLIAFIARAFWRVMDGVIAGVRGGQPPHVPQPGTPRSVPMARDPVCGTFVLPDRAVTLSTGGETVFFCSDRCRDAYRSGRAESSTARGRTA
jgi:YHS domain-containing protein